MGVPHQSTGEMGREEVDAQMSSHGCLRQRDWRASVARDQSEPGQGFNQQAFFAVITARKGRTELVTVTANTHLVTKQFGKDPQAAGNVPLGNESHSDGFLQGFVSERGHLFPEVRGPAGQIRWTCRVPGPPWHSGRSL